MESILMIQARRVVSFRLLLAGSAGDLERRELGPLGLLIGETGETCQHDNDDNVVDDFR